MKSIPFHRHDFSTAEIKAVTKVLKGTWITGGEENIALEKDLCRFLSARDAVSLSSATAALFLSLKLFGIKDGDEVITSPYSFVATANVIRSCGAEVVFADIGSNYNLNPEAVLKAITSRTKAIIAVDYGGYPCDYPALKRLPIPFRPEGLFQEALGRPLVLADSAHSIGTRHSPPGPGEPHHPHHPHHQYADVHCYSFHAVKNITGGEGGAVTVMHQALAKAGFGTQLRQLRLHGLNRDAYQRESKKQFFYDMEVLGYKANLNEMGAALVRTQLKRIHGFEKKKKRIKKVYDLGFAQMPGIRRRQENEDLQNWHVHPHLYTLEWDGFAGDEDLKRKEAFFRAAQKAGVSLNFHFLPIPLFTYYRQLGYSLNHLPVTRRIYPLHFSLPLYPGLTIQEASRVVEVIGNLTQKQPTHNSWS